MSIVLIGYRGSGKTTVGRLLAERLGWPFVDCDERITATAGKTIREIFEAGGEERFRELECQAVAEISQLGNHVLSLGGGAILRSENRDVIARGRHKVVYLRATPEELHRRIHADTATAVNRPALTKLGGGIEEIRSVLAAREPIYRQVMTAEVDVTQRTPEEVVTAIVELLKGSDKS
jgi:shikimate kinase